MAETKKVTKKDNFRKVLELVKDHKDLVDFINHEIELLENKASKSGQTKTQKENEDIKVKIVASLRNIGKAVTITDLQASDTDMATYSNQKLSALLKQLVDNGAVVKTTDKKKSYFSVNQD